MVGLAQSVEVSTLDNLFGVTRYLRLLRWTGPRALGGGQVVNDDGSLPSGVVEVVAASYAPLAVTAARWSPAAAGAPTTKALPVSGSVGFTPAAGEVWSQVTGYCWTSDALPISSANLIASGVFIDASAHPTVTDVSVSRPLVWTPAQPLIERLGGPPVGTNPT